MTELSDEILKQLPPEILKLCDEFSKAMLQSMLQVFVAGVRFGHAEAAKRMRPPNTIEAMRPAPPSPEVR